MLDELGNVCCSKFRLNYFSYFLFFLLVFFFSFCRQQLFWGISCCLHLGVFPLRIDAAYINTNSLVAENLKDHETRKSTESEIVMSMSDRTRVEPSIQLYQGLKCLGNWKKYSSYYRNTQQKLVPCECTWMYHFWEVSPLLFFLNTGKYSNFCLLFIIGNGKVLPIAASA